MYLLGFDIGSSSVKVSLVEARNSATVATQISPLARRAPLLVIMMGFVVEFTHRRSSRTAKSIYLTKEGEEKAIELAKKYFK